MFHAVYVGTQVSSLSINVKANAPGNPVVPLTLQPEYPMSIPYNSATAVQILWDGNWTDWMSPVYIPTTVPGTNGKLKVNWSSDDQVLVLMDEQTSS